MELYLKKDTDGYFENNVRRFSRNKNLKRVRRRKTTQKSRCHRSVCVMSDRPDRSKTCALAMPSASLRRACQTGNMATQMQLRGVLKGYVYDDDLVTLKRENDARAGGRRPLDGKR